MQSKQMQAQVSSSLHPYNHNQAIFDYLKSSSQPHPFGQLHLKILYSLSPRQIKVNNRTREQQHKSLVNETVRSQAIKYQGKRHIISTFTYIACHSCTSLLTRTQCCQIFVFCSCGSVRSQ